MILSKMNYIVKLYQRQQTINQSYNTYESLTQKLVNSSRYATPDVRQIFVIIDQIYINITST